MAEKPFNRRVLLLKLETVFGRAPHELGCATHSDRPYYGGKPFTLHREKWWVSGGEQCLAMHTTPLGVTIQCANMRFNIRADGKLACTLCGAVKEATAPAEQKAEE